jgi:hypothetical protein
MSLIKKVTIGIGIGIGKAVIDRIEGPKPVKKSGNKRLDNKVSKALKGSGGKCIKCKRKNRKGGALWCSGCLKKMWSF